MATAPQAPRHRRVVIALHWLTALLLAGGLGAVLLRELVDDRGTGRVLLDGHRQLGLGLLLLAALRGALRLAWRTGQVNGPALAGALRLASRAGHWLLYAGLLATPVLGWALSNARGQALRLFGLLPLPTLVARDRDLADSLQSVHETLAWSLVVLTALHVAAALWHHFGRRDHVLRSMLPWAPAIEPVSRDDAAANDPAPPSADAPSSPLTGTDP